jgi:hypothetical protein
MTMSNPKNKKYYKYKGIEIKLRKVIEHGKAIKYRICGKNTSQAIYIPLSSHNEDGSFKDLTWFWDKPNNKYKLKLAGVIDTINL